MRLLLCLLVFIPISIPSAWSAPTIDCHCFRDRQFNPQNPAGVDNYVLATCQNSLIAAIFKVDKKPIVKARMTGVSSRQIWVSHYLAAQLGKTAAGWLGQYASRGGWQKVVSELSAAEREKLGAWFQNAHESGLGEAVISRNLGEALTVPAPMLQAMRDSGGDDRAVIAASILGRLAEVPPNQVLRSVQEGRKTWGEWVVSVGLEPVDLGIAIQGLVPSS